MTRQIFHCSDRMCGGDDCRNCYPDQPPEPEEEPDYQEIIEERAERRRDEAKETQP